MTLVELTAFHADIVAELHRTSFQENWSAKAFAELMTLPASFGFLALKDDQPVGFILCQGDAVEAEIITIATQPAARRTGIAGQLVTNIGSKTQRLFLEVAEDNPAALAFYTQFGFTQVGRRKNYYKHHNRDDVDALVMEKSF